MRPSLLVLAAVAAVAAVAALAGGVADARECGAVTRTVFRDSLVGYKWSVALGEPLLPITAESEREEVKERGGRTEYHADPHFLQMMRERTEVKRDNTYVAPHHGIETLAPPRFAEKGQRLRVLEGLEVELGEATDLKLAKATHTVVVPKKAFLVIEHEHGAGGEETSYVRVPTLHNEVALRLKSPAGQFAVVPVGANGRVAVSVTVNRSNGRRSVSTVGADGATIRLYTNWTPHPSEPGKTLPAVHAKVVSIPGSVERGKLAKCLSPRELCPLIQHAFEGKSADVHQEFMCATHYESGWVPSVFQHAANPDGSMDAGLAQINSVHWARLHGTPGDDCSRNKWKGNDKCLAIRDKLLDAATNLAAARDIYNKQGVRAWYGYRDNCSNSRYKKLRFACPVSESTPKDTEARKWLRS